MRMNGVTTRSAPIGCLHFGGKCFLKRREVFLCLEQEGHVTKAGLQNAHSDVTENDGPVRGAVCAGSGVTWGS